MNIPADFKPEGTEPAALPIALQQRLLTAMQQASDEEQECREMEQLLRRFRPAAMSAYLVGHLGVRMYVEAQHNKRPGHRRYWLGGSAAAAAVALMAVGTSLLMPGNAVAKNENQGLVCRNIIESHKSNRVEWRRGEAPVRHYTVVYEDSFVLDSDGSTTVIRVPNTTEVEVEEDYL